MLRSIMVGLDGSVHTDSAIELGLRWAKRFDCLLIGIGVVDEPTLRGSQTEISRSYQKAYDQLVASETIEVEQCLEKFTLRCTEAGVAHKLLESVGSPCEQILLQSQRYDLVLFGKQTHFRAGKHEHPCKTLESVVRNAARPVVTVPETLASSDSSGGVLVAYDGSVQASRSIQAFLATGLHKLGDVHILCAHGNSKVEAAKIADRAAEFLRFHGVEANPIPVVCREGAGNCFTEHAAKLGAELIVMGAYGQPQLSEFFFGSATCTALKHSKVPLFLYH